MVVLSDSDIRKILPTRVNKKFKGIFMSNQQPKREVGLYIFNLDDSSGNASNEKDSIGKRYRRQDAIGTPFAVTVDHQSLEDNTVTIRDRDTMEQERVAITELHSIIEEKVSMRGLLS